MRSVKGMRVIRIFGGILLLVLLHSHAMALSNSYSVTLAWAASPSAGVTGYRVYYGAASGNYSNSVTVGNVTTNSVPGLLSGVTYFFAVAAFNAGGVESPLSNEIRFVPGLPTIRIRVTAAGQAVLTVQGLIGHTYDIQATQDLKTWSVLGAVTLGDSGAASFTNSNTAGFSRRFYRTRDTMP